MEKLIQVFYVTFRVADDMDDIKVMWEALAKKYQVECEDWDMFCDTINSVKSFKDQEYFKNICKEHLKEKLPF